MKRWNKLWLRSLLWCLVCLISTLTQILSPQTKNLFCTPLQLPGADMAGSAGQTMERIK